MDNREIARVLRETADLMEVAGDDPFRVRGYRKAADTIAGAAAMTGLLAEPAQLRALPGIGPKLAEAIQQIATTGTFALHDELLRRYQPGMLELLNVQGLGPKTIATIWERHGVATVDGVEGLAQAGKLRTLPRMSEKKEAQILQAIATYRAVSGRFLRSTAERAAMVARLGLTGKSGVRAVEIGGAFRRGEETVAELELVAGTEAGREEETAEEWAALPEVAEVKERGPGYAVVEWADGGGSGRTMPVQLRAIPSEAFGARWIQITGPASHWEALQARAAQVGMELTPSGLRRQGAVVAGGSEEEIYRALGLSWIPPELREMEGVLGAAESDSLPRLVAVGDIRCDLHMHTVETDGRATIEEMAAAALKRGYAAIAITDHSQALAMARGLNEERAMAHVRRIRAADQAMGGQLRIFTGIEVDILADGRLDLADAVLGEMDIVIASVHSRFEQTAEEMTARLLRAVGNRQVRILGHPTGRRLLRRPAYAFDFERVATACAAEGVAMEINAAPERLDLSADLARKAAATGVRIAINTDAHHPDHLDFIRHGVATARRAGIGPERVVNTLEPAALLAALRAKP